MERLFTTVIIEILCFVLKYGLIQCFWTVPRMFPMLSFLSLETVITPR